MKKEVEICDLCGIETAKIKCVLCKVQICKECCYMVDSVIKVEGIDLHFYKPFNSIEINKIYICRKCKKLIGESTKTEKDKIILIKGLLDILYKNALAEKL